MSRILLKEKTRWTGAAGTCYGDILAPVCIKRLVEEESRKWRYITMGEYRTYWSEPMATLSPEGFYEVQTRALLKELDYVWKRSLF